MYQRFGLLFNEIDECIRDLVHFCIQKASVGPYGMIRDSTVRYGVVRYGTAYAHRVHGFTVFRAETRARIIAPRMEKLRSYGTPYTGIV